jgi:hypothetical protein
MPTTWNGSKEDRLKRLDERGRRCDGAARTCPQTAVMAYELMPVNPADGTDRPGTEPVVQQACGKHRRAVSERATFRVLSRRELPRPQVTEAQRRAAALRNQQLRSLIGCRFVAHPGEPPRLVTRTAPAGGQVQLIDEGGNTFLLSEVHQIELPAGYDGSSGGTGHAREQAARRRVPTPPRPELHRPYQPR